MSNSHDGVFSSKSDPELSLGFKDLASRLGDTGGPISTTSSVNLAAAGNAFGLAHLRPGY